MYITCKGLIYFQLLFSVPGGVSLLQAADRDAAVLLQPGLVQHRPGLLPQGHRDGRVDPLRKKWIKTGLRRFQGSSGHKVIIFCFE